jgi:hypothetical protein
VYNTRLSGDRTIGTVALTLIEVAEKRLGSVEESKTTDGLTLRYSSRARTLIDAVYDWSRFAGLPRGYEWIRNELVKKRVAPRDLIRDAIQYGNQGTIRRIGALLEAEGVRAELLREQAGIVAARCCTDIESPVADEDINHQFDNFCIIIDYEDLTLARFEIVERDRVFFHEFDQALPGYPAEFRAGDAKTCQPARIETTDYGLLAHFADIGSFTGREKVLHLIQSLYFAFTSSKASIPGCLFFLY